MGWVCLIHADRTQNQESVFRCYALLESSEEILQRLLDLAIEMLRAANANI